MLPYHPGARVGTYPDQSHDTRQGIVELAVTAGYPLPQPHHSKSDEVGSKENELFLQGDAAPGTHLEGVHLEDDVGYLDARLNRLSTCLLYTSDAADDDTIVGDEGGGGGGM